MKRFRLPKMKGLEGRDVGSRGKGADDRLLLRGCEGKEGRKNRGEGWEGKGGKGERDDVFEGDVARMSEEILLC